MRLDRDRHPPMERMSRIGGVTAVSPIPLHTQIREALRRQILDGTYPPHSQMPSESQMMGSFGVSRITIRQALGDLQKEGLIFKVMGKGSFVAKPKAFQTLSRLQGFGEAMAPSGHETYSRLLGAREIEADAVVAQRLGLREGAAVYELRRLRFLNREPISVDVSHFPPGIGRRLAQEDLATRDIFAILENDLGHHLTHADLQIEAICAEAGLARLLGIAESAPLLRIERLAWAGGNPIDFEYLYYRGDAFQYRLRVERA